MKSLNDLTVGELELALADYEAGKLNPTTYGLSVSLSTFKRYLRTWRQLRGKVRKDFAPFANERIYDDYLKVNSNNFIVISDIEIPDHDPFLMRAVELYAAKNNIHDIVYAGDVVSLDQKSLNSWKQRYVEDKEFTLKTTVGMVRDMVNSHKKQFKNRWMFTGNHDERVAIATGGEVSLDMLIADTGVVFSPYRYMWIKINRKGNDEWVYICHPENNSKAASLNMVRQLYNVISAPDGSKPHIIAAHTHSQERGLSPDGQRECIALGCMRDQNRTRYKSMTANTFRQWSGGFLVCKNGYFDLLWKEQTDWRSVFGTALYSKLVSSG